MRQGRPRENVHRLRDPDALQPRGNDRKAAARIDSIKFWTRKKFKGTAALKKKVNPTRIPIEKKESILWLENVQQTTELLAIRDDAFTSGGASDIFELFCAAREAGTHFLIKTCVDRLDGAGHGIAFLFADRQQDAILLISRTPLSGSPLLPLTAMRCSPLRSPRPSRDSRRATGRFHLHRQESGERHRNRLQGTSALSGWHARRIG